MRKSCWLAVLLLTVSIINYPNPFDPRAGGSVTFECTADTTQEEIIYLYDMTDRLLLRRAFSLAGGAASRLSWNGYGDNNELVASGLYPYRLVEAATKRPLAKGKVWVINR